MTVIPYTDAQIDALRGGEHAELLPNCPTCKWLATVEAMRKRAIRFHHALEMVRASIDNVSCLVELDKRIRRDLQQISRYIDLELAKDK